MATLQGSAERTLRNLRDMSLSQKIAIGLGALLVAGSLAWMLQWSARSDLTPLLSQPLSGEELAQIQSGLSELGVNYRVEGGQVLVPSASDRRALLAQLSQSGRMPADTSISFAQLVQETNPWISNQENDRRWSVALKAEIERVLLQFNGVRGASVLLNVASATRSFSRQQPEASASVTLTMASGEPVGRNLALAAARLVSGAVRGLPLRNVQVLDSNGRAALDWDDEEPGGVSGLLRLCREIERATAAKIAAQLGFDRQVRVDVSCELEHSTLRQESSKPEEGVKIEESTMTSSTGSARSAAAPGVQPNVALDAGGGGRQEQNTTETGELRYQPGMTTISTHTPAGQVKRLSAAINLPYSYLARVYAMNNPNATPSEADIQKIFENHRSRIVAHVAKLLVPPSEEQVAVDWYYDDVAPQAEAASAPAAAAMSFEVLKTFGPGAGLVGLALLSFMLMFRMSRAADRTESMGLELGLPKDAIEAARRAAEDLERVRSIPRPRGAGGGGASDVRVAGESPPPEPVVIIEDEPAPVVMQRGRAVEAVLEGHEIDQDTVQVSGMIDQVALAAQKDEESIAGLLEHWITRPQS